MLIYCFDVDFIGVVFSLFILLSICYLLQGVLFVSSVFGLKRKHRKKKEGKPVDIWLL